MISVKVYSIATSGTECVLLLEETEGPRLLPIWIGITEGHAIALKFTNVNLPRPMTHDLMMDTMERMGCKLQKVVVNDLKGTTFYAQLHVHVDSKDIVVDSRPSDAIALAVRAQCPIFVDEKVFEKCHTMHKPISETEVTKFKDELKHLTPEDIFKGLREKKKKKPAEGNKEPPDIPDPEDE